MNEALIRHFLLETLAQISVSAVCSVIMLNVVGSAKKLTTYFLHM